nr:hypothetical protein [Bacteroides sp. 51]
MMITPMSIFSNVTTPDIAVRLCLNSVPSVVAATVDPSHGHMCQDGETLPTWLTGKPGGWKNRDTLVI